MTTPTGLPVWARSASFEDYGGHVSKRNHLSQGVIDPETDVGAEHVQRLSADLAAVARVAPFGFFTVQCNDTAVADPTVEQAFIATGVLQVSYEGDAPPSGFPTVTRTGDGVFSVQFESSYADDYDVESDFIVQPGIAGNLTTDGGTACIEKISATLIAVAAFDAAGAADADALISFTVYSGGT
jgi:hypothetical protein